MSNNLKIAIVTALITVIGVISTAYFNYLSARTVVELPIRITQTAEAHQIVLTESAHYTTDIMTKNYVPSGWMGETQNLQMDPIYHTGCYSAPNCFKIMYKPSDATKWAGVSWQYPPNNWGDKPGCNFRGAKAVSFWAKGEKGTEKIKVTAAMVTTDWTEEGIIILNKNWTNYTIDLQDKDLSNISGAFGFFIAGSDNPDGLIFYLDSIEYTGISLEQVTCP